eukprot:4480942-Pleurochrysis_carterae.AAC.1
MSAFAVLCLPLDVCHLLPVSACFCASRKSGHTGRRQTHCHLLQQGPSLKKLVVAVLKISAFAVL